VLQIAIFVLQRLFHQHVKLVRCFVHPIVYSTFIVKTIIKLLKNDQVEGTCCSLLSSSSTCIWWKGIFAIMGCWGSLLEASTGYIPLAWKCGCSCGWIVSWIGCCSAFNFNFLFKASCDYSWHLTKIINLDFLSVTMLLRKW